MTRIDLLSDTRIRLHSRPPLWLLGSLWALFLGFLIGVCPSHQMTLTRTQAGTTDVRVAERLFGIPLSRQTLRDLRSAVLEMSENRSRSRGGSGSGVTLTLDDTSRIVLITATGEVPLTRGYATGLAKRQRAVDQVNGFLNSPKPTSLVVPVGNSLWVWAAAAFLGFAAIGSSTAAWCECLIDKEAGFVRITWASVPRPAQRNYRLSEVKRFEVAQADDPMKETVFYTLGMRLRDGTHVSITRQMSSFDGSRPRELAEIVERFRRHGSPTPR